MLVWGRRSEGTRPIRRDGEVVARVRPLELRDHAGVDLDGTHWSYFARAGELFAERSDDAKPALRATMVTRGTYAVHADRAEYRIERFGMPRSPFAIARSGVSIGSSATVGFWSRRPTLAVEAATPLDDQVFLLWVAFVMRGRPGVRTRRNTYAGGSGGPSPAADGYGFETGGGGGMG